MVQHTIYPRYAYLEYVTAWSNNYILDMQTEKQFLYPRYTPPILDIYQ